MGGRAGADIPISTRRLSTIPCNRSISPSAVFDFESTLIPAVVVVVLGRSVDKAIIDSRSEVSSPVSFSLAAVGDGGLSGNKVVCVYGVG